MPSDDRRRIAHLLRRAGFGASPADLVEFDALGFDAAVERLLAPEAFPDDGALDQAFDALAGDPNQRGLAAARWLYRMAFSPRPLEEKIAWFWHGHFATSIEKVKSEPLMERQAALFRRLGLGRFEELTVEVSRDPAMLIWLDNWQSKRAAPNENFGRELLELFILGLGAYDEGDVAAATRAFTGWTLDVSQRGPGMTSPTDSSAAMPDPTLSDEERMRMRREQRQEQLDNAEFLFRPDWHDDGEKTFLGQTGPWGGEDILRTATGHPACAEFIAAKLFAFFVWDDPDEATIEPYAAVFAETGGDIRETLRKIFASADFSSDRAYRAKIKSPVEFLVGFVRGLGGSVVGRDVFAALRSMGQSPYAPPHVGGWPSGLAWFGPSTTFARANLINDLLGGGAIDAGRPSREAADLNDIYGEPLPAAADEAVASIADRLLDGDLDDGHHQALSQYLSLGPDGQPTPFSADFPTYEAKLYGLIRLAANTPTYHLN